MQFKCKTSLHDLRGRVDIAKYMVYIIFLCTIGLFAIWLGDTFFSLTNILNITRQTAMISVMAVAMVFVIATGGIDLTVSGVVPISGLLCAIVLEKTDNMFAGIAVALLVGTLIGAINGTFITYMKIPAFLMTLGMQFALKGVAMWISDTKSVPIYHKTFNHIFGYSDVFGIPVLLIWTIVFVIIGVILLRLRPFGRAERCWPSAATLPPQNTPASRSTAFSSAPICSPASAPPSRVCSTPAERRPRSTPTVKTMK